MLASSFLSVTREYIVTYAHNHAQVLSSKHRIVHKMLTSAAWRKRWRGIGFSLDRLLPRCCVVPAPSSAELPGLVTTSFTVPQFGKHVVCEDDVRIVVDSARFVLAYVAEFLPVQVVDSDWKRICGTSASALAVRDIHGEKEYVGSFDLLLHVHCHKDEIWKGYDDSEIALDARGYVHVWAVV